MLKFLPGILLLQIITISLFLLAPQGLSGWEWLRLLIPLGIVALLIAFWFGSLAQQLSKDAVIKLKESHAKEREKIKVNAERAKTRLLKQTQKETTQEIRKQTTKANMKVGAALAGVAAFGGLLLLTQFITLGITLMATAGGALGGYVMRIKHERQKLITQENQSAGAMTTKAPAQSIEKKRSNKS